MHAVSITWARNEEDIIECFVRHNAAIVDRMMIILHRCTDASHDILLNLIREGLPVEIIESDAPYHAQSEYLTRILRSFVVSEYRWIVPLDADEFLCDLMGNPRSILQTLPADSVYDISWKTYIPTPNDDSSQRNPPKRITHHRTKELPQFTKVLIPGYLAQQAVISPGSHDLLHLSGNRYEGSTHPTLYLAHFPIRSERQLRKKIIDGWKSHCANPDRKPNQAFQWEMLFERCQNPVPITREELQQIAIDYAVPREMQKTPNEIVYDPVPDVCSKRVPHLA